MSRVFILFWGAFSKGENQDLMPHRITTREEEENKEKKGNKESRARYCVDLVVRRMSFLLLLLLSKNRENKSGEEGEREGRNVQVV